MSTTEERVARIQRLYPVAFDRCVRDLFRQLGVKLRDDDAQSAHAATLSFALLDVEHHRALAEETAAEIPVDTMSDDELLAWFVEDMRDGVRRMFFRQTMQPGGDA